MGLADSFADGLDEGELWMSGLGSGVKTRFVRNWGKLPYPKFLETTSAAILRDGVVAWEGKCYFAARIQRVQSKDGVHENVDARATISEDISEIVRRFAENCVDMEFRVKGRRFIIVRGLPAHNPDGSFHHLRLGVVA